MLLMLVSERKRGLYGADHDEQNDDRQEHHDLLAVAGEKPAQGRAPDRPVDCGVGHAAACSAVWVMAAPTASGVT